ncbi:hypothetical protein ACFUOZ_20935 [Paenarthrobacter sp. NPDC057355]|uniref:hypothetical protein n=1 Tax=Paenarthrobacter sp. NPDC057355 TaxID=3346105 RepID=UPI003633B9B9
MAEMKDRPELPQRRGPKPAPDERLDPVDTAPSSLRTAPSAPAAQSNPVARKKREATIAIGPRISVSVMEILDRAVEEEGITQRQALEEAIISRWGSK